MEHFPAAHRWTKQERASPWGGHAYVQDTAVPSRYATFEGEFQEVVEETYSHPIVAPFKTKRGMHYHKLAYLTFEFVAPFKKANEDLLLSDVVIDLRGPEAEVLLDKAMEEGMELSKDFEFLKVSRYIRVKSEKMRLFLSMQFDIWPSFDMVVQFTHPKEMVFNFLLDDLKPSKG